MKLIITDKTKKDSFIALFQLLKNCSNAVNITINDDFMYIQGMDKAHICLFEIHIVKSWFETYEKTAGDSSHICIPINIFHSILAFVQDSQSIIIHYEGDDIEHIHIDLLGSGSKDVNKYFTIPLIELDCDLLNIPDIDYDAEFSMNAKKVNDIVSQLMMFGDNMSIKCSEEEIFMGSSGQEGEMHVNIPIDDLNEFSINEGDSIDLSYSLHNVYKLCLSNKLSTIIEFAISKDSPMRIKYDLGNDSYIRFFIAPKIE